MLPKQNRLHTSFDIGQVRSSGQRFHSDIVTLIVSRSDQPTMPTFAFIVSTKISKKALERNRTKRLLREAVHGLLPNTTPGISVVCIAKTSLASVPLARVAEEMTKLFRSARILE